jgi:hypothetical protein
MLGAGAEGMGGAGYSQAHPRGPLDATAWLFPAGEHARTIQEGASEEEASEELRRGTRSGKTHLCHL